MDLYLLQNDPCATLFAAKPDQPQYKVETSKESSAEPTTILRIDSEFDNDGGVQTIIGRVDYPSGQDIGLRICLVDIELTLHPVGGQDLHDSWSFVGPDNMSYKWQMFIQAPILILNDNSHTMLARYRRAKLGIVSRSRRASLEVSPVGLKVVDLIVVTFVSFMKHRATAGYYRAS